MSVEQIERADAAELAAAELALKSARNTSELASIWFRDCDRFEGSQRERLQKVYTRQLFKCGALQP
jgi:hypothetical protein